MKRILNLTLENCIGLQCCAIYPMLRPKSCHPAHGNSLRGAGSGLSRDETPIPPTWQAAHSRFLLLHLRAVVVVDFALPELSQSNRVSAASTAAAMLDFEAPTVYERSKCFFTYGRMAHIDPQQLPTEWPKKGKPWSTVLGKDFIRRVSDVQNPVIGRKQEPLTDIGNSQLDLVLPHESWQLFQTALPGFMNGPEFCRVTMALSEILQGDFFNEYIKIGRSDVFRRVTGAFFGLIIFARRQYHHAVERQARYRQRLHAQGWCVTSNFICSSPYTKIDLQTKTGKLTMYLDKEAYERAGLVGKPYGAKGNRGLRPRWVVEFDLRSPSMFRGKKGFDRLVYACKNVFNEPVTWLFCNDYHKGKLS